MSSTNTINLAVDKFKNSVKKLSNQINGVGMDWNDEKHAKLKALISDIANNSKTVVNSANAFSSTVSQFESISNS